MPTPKRYLPSPLKALLILAGLALFTALVIRSCTRQEGPPRIGLSPGLLPKSDTVTVLSSTPGSASVR